MTDPSHQIATAFRQLAEDAAPPHVRVDAAWRAGRRRRRAVIVLPAAAVTAALTAGLLTVLPGENSSYSLAAYVLDRAAQAAARSDSLTPRPGQYVAVASVAASMTEVDAGSGKAGSWLTVERRTIWWPVSNLKPGVEWYEAVRNEHLPWGGQPAGTGLGASWLRIPAEGCPGAPPRRFTYHFLASLPTQPAKLRAWVYAHPGGGQDADDQAWTDINDLLATTLTPPKLTSALFRVAATIPGAIVIKHVTDAAGRQGIAVARNTLAFSEEDELIFAARTYRLLGGRTTLTAAEHGIGPAGTVIGAWALLSKTVVSHLPPGNHDQTGASNHC
jgi:hypothetical protein